MHLDADAVSRLMKFGEAAVYLSANDLEWVKGPVSEEEILVAKDIEAHRRRRIQRAETRKQEGQEMRGDSSIDQKRGNDLAVRSSMQESDRRVTSVTERRSNAVRKVKPPPARCTSGPKIAEQNQRYPLRVRQGGVEGPNRPGWDRFEGKRASPAEEVMVQRHKCGYNRLRVVESTLEGAGYGLFLRILVVKAGGLHTSYEGARLTRSQAEASGSDYIFKAPSKKGGILLFIYGCKKGGLLLRALHE